MTQKFYVDKNGNYLGSWDGSEPDASLNAIEVKIAPQSATQVWDKVNKTWSVFVAPIDEKTDTQKLAELLKAKGVVSAADIVTLDLDTSV